MKVGICAVTAVIAVMGLCAPSLAAGSPGGVQTDAPQNHLSPGQMTQDQFNKMQEYVDTSKRLTKEDQAKGRTLEQVLAEDKAAAIELVKTMPLACDVTDALRVAEGPETVNGKPVQTATYEVACANGLGYFLVSQTPERPYGFSCFTAAHTRDIDVKAGRKPSAVCALPVNADLKVLAGNVLSKSGVLCTVKDTLYVGQNSKNNTEFNEIACDSGAGYMVVSALPGSLFPVHAETCNQSAIRGLPCKMSDNGKLPMTLGDFRKALADKNIACDATDKTTRVIGLSNTTKRYVVEFQCSQHPKGLVAYFPQEDSKSPFEAIDCPAAAKRGAMCALSPTK